MRFEMCTPLLAPQSTVLPMTDACSHGPGDVLLDEV